MSETAEERGAGGALEDMDPFTPRLAFVDRVFKPKVRTWYDRTPIRPIEPLDSGADQIIDQEALEKLANWQGLVKRPKVMHEDNYPTEVDEAMQVREPQFILRNLGRVEKEVDPNEKLAFDRREVPLGASLVGLDSAAHVKHEPPELLGEMTVSVVQGLHAGMRALYREPWNRRFSKEIRADHTGPMWSYDPAKAEAKKAAKALAEALEECGAETPDGAEVAAERTRELAD